MSDVKVELPENSRIVQPNYLEKNSSKKDLVRRLRNLVLVLRGDDIEAESAEWPGLAAVAHTLVHKYLHHADKEVRLYTVLACVDILTIYAPDVPWDEHELLDIFGQMTRQLGNLAHTFEGPVFQQYRHILDLLANVRIGCILVDLANQREDDGDEEDEEMTLRHHKSKETPLDVFVEFLSTLLYSVRREHPAEVLELVQQAISTCLVEYHPTNGVPFPIPILDLLLHSIGQGPTQLVLAPAATSNKKGSKSAAAAGAVRQMEVANPTYQVAAAVIRTLLNKVATPISQLLNGLLHREPYVVDQSSIRCLTVATDDNEVENQKNNGSNKTAAVESDSNDNEIYNIIFELHRVAPQILATVLGTVANGLRSALTTQRYQVTLLLGRLFAVSDMAEEYAACFREWLGRKLDVDPNIRLCVMKQCMAILVAVSTKRAPGAPVVDPEIALVTAEALTLLVTSDPSLDVRMEAIHLICDWAYKAAAGSPVTASLLQAVGSRVSAKHKQERRDAVTGLAHVYFRQYLQPHLKAVIEGGDDCDIEIIFKALHGTCHLEPAEKSHKRGSRRQHDEDWTNVLDEQYRWIPARVLECVYFTDQTDTEMRSRVVQIVDELLLGSGKKMTPTAQAIGWTAMLDSVVEGGAGSLLLNTGGHSNAFKFLQQMLGQRAALQKTVSRYIDARTEIREYEAGTEKAIEADARAMEVLELVARMTAPVDGTKTSIEDVLQDLHGARDKHIFRILATIVDPAHTTQSRARALEELPRRTKVLGDAVSDWVKNLVKRCAMGDSLNSEVVSHCVLLAQECFRAGDIPAVGALLASVKMAVHIFPALCSSSETFVTLTEIFSECRSSTGEVKKELHASGIVTALSSILSAVAISQPGFMKDKDNTNKDELKNQLMQLCTRDGTPEQARNAVYTLVRLIDPDGKYDSVSSDEFTPLLRTLTSASSLKISTDGKDSLRIVSILSALSALTDCAPLVLKSSTRGEKIVKLSLEGIILGRAHLGDDSGSDGESGDDETVDSPSASSKKRRRSPSATNKKHVTPEAKTSLLEDECLSVACRRICAAVDFLVSHIRSTTLMHFVLKSKPSSTAPKITLIPSSQVRLLFQLLTQIIKEQGLPPSNRDRKLCGSRQDRAALRQCSAVSLLRLCDARLCMEKEMLSQSMWHTLSSAFLDEERVVREAAMEELSLFFKGSGIYGVEKSMLPPKAPSLRFLALITLCSDGDREQDAANGSAANVAKVATMTRNSALHCIVNLRKMSETTYTQCCAMGKNAEKRFESHIKMMIMPEYSVPYAFHLLSHRRETPSESSITVGYASDEDAIVEDEGRAIVSDEGQQRILRKRLKLLFDPLVQSLGDGADNISFLLRMTEILGKHYSPVEVAITFASNSSSGARHSIDSNGSIVEKPWPNVAGQTSQKTQLHDAKLKTICTVAREVLLSYVKKDVNLSIYPGMIQLPASLFKKSDKGTVRLSQQSVDSSLDSDKGSRTGAVKTPVGSHSSLKRRSDRSSVRLIEAQLGSSSSQKAKDARVTFSPIVQYRAPAANKNSFGNLSPIAKSCSPASLPSSRGRDSKVMASSADTLGTTPPADLCTATAPDATFDELSYSSSKASRTPDSKVQDCADPSPSENVTFDLQSTQSIDMQCTQSIMPLMRSTTESSEASVVTLSQTDEIHLNRLSQSSGQSSNPSTSKLRKRRATVTLRDKPEAKKQKNRSIFPTQVKVKKVDRRRAQKPDDLDFDFYDEANSENKPVARNQSKNVKGKGRKANAARTTVKVSKAKGRTTTARSQSSRH